MGRVCTPRRWPNGGRKHIHTLNWLVAMVIDGNDRARALTVQVKAGLGLRGCDGSSYLVCHSVDVDMLYV